LAGKLRQTEIEGEFADETGATVVRRLTWQDDHSRGSAVLIRRDVLQRICAELGVELAFDDYADLQGRTADGELDNDQPLLRRWRLTPTTDRELSKDVVARTNHWEAAHGALDPEERFRCHYFWALGGEVGLDIALCVAERDRAIRVDDETLAKQLERRLKALEKKLRADGADT
jgi:hypothetical protein